tara:strand:- start:1547 stop:1813 length:267 start_codon:yes stop_codon:yes gene_type:complete
LLKKTKASQKCGVFYWWFMQTKRRSLIEAVTNVLIGYLVAVISNLIVLPLFGYQVSLFDGFAIGVVFTVISLIRSYVIRRLFNKYDSQ